MLKRSSFKKIYLQYLQVKKVCIKNVCTLCIKVCKIRTLLPE